MWASQHQAGQCLIRPLARRILLVVVGLPRTRKRRGFLFWFGNRPDQGAPTATTAADESSQPRIQYSDRALERLLARDVPSADVTAKDAAVCQSERPRYFGFSFFFPLHSVEATVIIFVTFHVFPLPSIMFFSREVLLTIILWKLN